MGIDFRNHFQRRMPGKILKRDDVHSFLDVTSDESMAEGVACRLDARLGLQCQQPGAGRSACPLRSYSIAEQRALWVRVSKPGENRQSPLRQIDNTRLAALGLGVPNAARFPVQ